MSRVSQEALFRWRHGHSRSPSAQGVHFEVRFSFPLPRPTHPPTDRFVLFFSLICMMPPATARGLRSKYLMVFRTKNANGVTLNSTYICEETLILRVQNLDPSQQ